MINRLFSQKIEHAVSGTDIERLRRAGAVLRTARENGFFDDVFAALSIKGIVQTDNVSVRYSGEFIVTDQNTELHAMAGIYMPSRDQAIDINEQLTKRPDHLKGFFVDQFKAFPTVLDDNGTANLIVGLTQYIPESSARAEGWIDHSDLIAFNSQSGIPIIEAGEENIINLPAIFENYTVNAISLALGRLQPLPQVQYIQ